MSEHAPIRIDLAGDLLERIENWRRSQRPKIPARKAAVLYLLRLGVEAARSEAFIEAV